MDYRSSALRLKIENLDKRVRINNIPSPVERGRGWGILSFKSSYKPHPKSFSTGEGLWKGRIYLLIVNYKSTDVRLKIENLDQRG